MPLPAAIQTPNLEDQCLERSNSRHQVSPTPETTRTNPSSGRWSYGREKSENFAESGDFHVILVSFTSRKFTTWDRRLYFPSEGRRAEDFFARKIRRLRRSLGIQNILSTCKRFNIGLYLSCTIHVNTMGSHIVRTSRYLFYLKLA